jgi:hypothetical protein
MFGRFYKLHFLLAAFIALLSPHYVLPRLSSFETTGQLYAAPIFALPVPATVTVTASSRVHQAWIFESAKHNAHHVITGNYSVSPAVQISRGDTEFGIICRPISYKLLSNSDRAPPASAA